MQKLYIYIHSLKFSGEAFLSLVIGCFFYLNLMVDYLIFFKFHEKILKNGSISNLGN